MAANFVRIAAAEALSGPAYIRSLRETLPAVQLVGADMWLDGYIPYLDAGVEVLEFRSSLDLLRLVEGEAWSGEHPRGLEGKARMIKVSMEVREGAALSRARVQAESIREAVSTTRGRYPGREVRVVFPIDAENFFIEGPAEGNGLAKPSVERSSIG
jgi:hypothetical protein